MKNKKIFAISLIVGLITVVFFVGWILNKKTNDVLEYARVLIRVGRYDLAIKTIEKNPWLIKSGKNYILVHSSCLINKKIVDTNNFSEAEKDILKRNIKKLENKRLKGIDLWTLGFIYENFDNKEKALECYQKVLDSQAIKDKTWRADLLSDMAHIYEALNNKDKAVEYYEKSINEDEANWFAKWRYMLRMLNIENLNGREKAKIFANEIVEIQGDLLSPVKEDSYNLLGRICLIEKTETKDGDCLKYFEKSLAINSNYSNTYDGLIWYYLHKTVDNDLLYITDTGSTMGGDEREMVLKYIYKSMDINNTRVWPFVFLSVMDELSGKRENARDSLKKALWLIDDDDSLWGESKNVLRSIVYFKFALLGNQKQSIKIDLDLAIKNDAKIRERIIKLSQNNPKDKRLEVIVGLLDK